MALQTTKIFDGRRGTKVPRMLNTDVSQSTSSSSSPLSSTSTPLSLGTPGPQAAGFTSSLSSSAQSSVISSTPTSSSLPAGIPTTPEPKKEESTGPPDSQSLSSTTSNTAPSPPDEPPPAPPPPPLQSGPASQQTDPVPSPSSNPAPQSNPPSSQSGPTPLQPGSALSQAGSTILQPSPSSSQSNPPPLQAGPEPSQPGSTSSQAGPAPPPFDPTSFQSSVTSLLPAHVNPTADPSVTADAAPPPATTSTPTSVQQQTTTTSATESSTFSTSTSTLLPPPTSTTSSTNTPVIVTSSTTSTVPVTSPDATTVRPATTTTTATTSTDSEVISTSTAPNPISQTSPTLESSLTSVAASSSSLSSAQTQPGVFVPISATLASQSPAASPDLESSSTESNLPSQTSSDFLVTSSSATQAVASSSPRSESLSSLVLPTTASGPTENLGASSASTSTSNHVPSQSPATEHKSQVDRGKIVAISAGAVSGALGLLVLIGLFIFCFKRRQRRKLEQSPTIAQLGNFGSPLGRSFNKDRFNRSLKAWFGKPIAVASGFKGRFHSRGPSSNGLVEDEPPMSMREAQNTYKSRRSRSEPPQGFTALSRPGRPSVEQYSRSTPGKTQQNAKQFQPAESPGPINQYQMPWSETPLVTPAPKTLRVVNSVTTDNTPAALPENGEMSTKDESYFSLMFPPRAISIASSSVHRRSVSLGPYLGEDPFMDAYSKSVFDARGLPTNVKPLPANKNVRNFGRVQLPALSSSTYGTQRSPQASRERDSGIYRASQVSQASVDASSPTGFGRAHLQEQGHTPANAASVRGSRPQDLNRKGSAVSSAEASIEAQHSESASSIYNSPIISPITDATTISRNTSDASSTTHPEQLGQVIPNTPLLKHASYDPFNYNGPKRSSMVATTLLVRNSSTASRRTNSSHSEGAFFLDSDSTLGYGEPGPTRPGTKYDSSVLTPGPRRTRAVSNDPFDLDRPEVLGYTPGAMKTRFDTIRRSGPIQRSDSSSSRGSVAGRTRTRRRSSVQEWSSIDADRNNAPKQTAGQRRS